MAGKKLVNYLTNSYENGGFVDERGYLTQIYDYMTSGVSPSEFQGAHQDIDKLIANADAETELASLFKFSSGWDVVNIFRHLNPAASTVTLKTGLSDIYYRNPEESLDALTKADAATSRSTSQTEAARMLAALRNKAYREFPSE